MTPSPDRSLTAASGAGPASDAAILGNVRTIPLTARSLAYMEAPILYNYT